MAQIDPSTVEVRWTSPIKVEVQRPSRVAGLGRFTGAAAADRSGHVCVFVLVVNFFIFQMLPGDPLARYKGARNISAEDLEQLRQELDAPLWEQFFTYLKDPLQLDSFSTIQGKPVWDVIGEALPWTLILLGTATLAGDRHRHLDRHPCRLEARQPVRQGVAPASRSSSTRLLSSGSV